MKIIKKIEDFYLYKDKYKEILKNNNYNSPYTTFSFITSWWKVFGEGFRLFIIASEKNNEIVGFSPLMIDKKEISFIGCPISTDMDFILNKDDNMEELQEVLDYLYNLKGYIVNLHGIREDSPNFSSIKSWSKNKTALLKKYTAEPFIKTENSFNEYVHKVFGSKNMREIIKKEKKLKELGDLKYEKINIHDIDKIFEIHKDRWRLKYDTSNFSEKKNREFFKLLHETEDADFQTDIKVISLDKEPIAFTYDFYKNKINDSYSFSFYNSYLVFALGKLILKYKIEECLNNNVSINLGVGIEPYKMEWTKDYINIYRLMFSKGKFAFLNYFFRENLRSFIKKSRKLILFRRNTLGKLRYFLKSINKKKFIFFIRKLLKFLLLPLGICLSHIKNEEDEIIILLYHRLNSSIDKELSVKEENFKWQMNYLSKHKYNVISLEEGLDKIKNKNIKGKNIIITFDDGYEDFYINGYPVLSSLKFPFILYIVPGFVDTNKVYWWDEDIKESRLLSWQQIISLSKKDYITIGSHSYNHRDLRELPLEEIKSDLKSSKNAIENKTGKEVSNFAYPQGFISEDLKAAAEEVYKSGVLINNGKRITNKLKNDDLYVLKRISVQNSDGKFLFPGRIKGWLSIEEKIKDIIKRL